MKDTNNNILKKLSLYSLSMWLFYLVVFLLSFKIPYGKSGVEWWAELWTDNSIITIVSASLFIFDLAIAAYYWYYVWKGTTEQPVKIIEIEQRNNDYFSFIVSVVFPIISFNLINSPLRHGIVLLVIYAFLGILYIRSNLYYVNPTLGMFGLKLYRVSGETNNGTTHYDKWLLSNNWLRKDDTFTYIQISDDVYYAKKM